jgi:pSer/pThr/pTyr-binding forkhead associated (FHA) protein
MGLAAINALGSNKLAFKSKVVSRAHAEIWVEVGGRFYIKDTKSSSGTFLNHVRLSPANAESRPHQIKDGDILQLGVDYQGGTEDIYKSVKIRVEVGREWQSAANAFKCVFNRIPNTSSN